MLKRLVVARTDNLLIQFGRYTLVGSVAFLADFGCLFALTEFLRIHYLVSAALAFLLGLSVNYLLSVAWVFRRHALTRRACEIGLFAAIGVVGLGFNELCMWFLTEQVGVYYLGSKIGSTGLVYLWNFLARRFMLFS